MFRNWLKAKGRGLKCAAVTPVGPGHVERAAECRASIEAAWRQDRGPFSALEFCFIDDSRGELGRSKARNIGVEAARRANADWIFFLDADDLMTPRAFAILKEHVEQFDAVWGLMAIKPPADRDFHIRFPQAMTLRSVDELLLLDPFMTLLMGHFVRTNVALELPFNEAMDAGEDFDYYVRAWEKYRCAKLAEVLSVNRADRHSTGPRAATADQWRVAATARLAQGMKARGLERHSGRAIAALNRCSEEAQAFSRARGEAAPDSLALFAGRLPYRGFVDVSGCTGGDFVLFSNNDDLVALNIGWIGDYQPALSRLWQLLASDAALILDIGAYTGYFTLLAARAAPAADIVSCEVHAQNFARLELNLALNEVRNVTAVRAALGGQDAAVERYGPVAGDVLPMVAALQEGGRAGTSSEILNAVSADSVLAVRNNTTPGAIRIDAGKLAGEVVAGLTRIFKGATPDLLIGGDATGGIENLERELRQHGYRFYAIDEAKETIALCEHLEPATRVGSVNHWATTRSAADADRVIAAAYCNPVGR